MEGATAPRERRKRSAGWQAAAASREWRAVFVAGLLSSFGDELARFALAYLIFSRTHSPLLTAASYAFSFLPSLAGALGLASLADRYPRRTVMIACDIGRTLVFLALGALDLPIGTVLLLVLVAGFAGPPFAAARAALVSEVLTDEAYVAGHTAGEVAVSLASAVAVFGAGITIAIVGPRGALIADAGTFLVSAVLLKAFVGIRPAASVDDAAPSPLAGLRVVGSRSDLRGLVVISAICGGVAAFSTSLAIVIARDDGHGAVGASVLVGAPLVAEIVAGALIIRSVTPAMRPQLIVPLALTSAVPLALCVGRPGFDVTVVLFFIAAVGSMFQVLASQEFMLRVPPAQRGGAFGAAAAVIAVTNGVVILAGGLVADYVQPIVVLGLAAIVAVGAVLVSGRVFKVESSTPTAWKA